MVNKETAQKYNYCPVAEEAGKSEKESDNIRGDGILMSHLADTTGVTATDAATGAATGQMKQQARSAAAATTCGLLPSPTDETMGPCSKILQKHPKRMWQQDQLSVGFGFLMQWCSSVLWSICIHLM